MHCECGHVTGEYCPSDSATVVVEYMPEHLKRIYCDPECAKRLVEDDPEWVSVIES